MKRSYGILFSIVLASIIFLGCASTGTITSYKFSDTVLTSSPIDLEITEVRIGTGNTHYYVYATVKNRGSTSIDFDAADVTIKSIDSDDTWYSITRGREPGSIELSPDVLTKRILEPGQTALGFIIYQTPRGQAIAAPLDLSYQNAAVRLDL